MNVLSEAYDSVKTINILVPQFPETEINQFDDILLNDIDFDIGIIDVTINDKSSKLNESVVGYYDFEDSCIIKTTWTMENKMKIVLVKQRKRK